ncbi:MAG: glycosyltransferase [Bdellovibrionales bacterium]|nr:glycosyltransferase [Bdellovibrionales bacterium]
MKDFVVTFRQFLPKVRWSIDVDPCALFREGRSESEIPARIKLSGWAFHPFHVVSFRLLYRKQNGIVEEIVRFGATRDRLDVQAVYPRIRSSLFSGFEIELPVEVVRGARARSLSLVAHAGVQKREIWTNTYQEPSKEFACSEDSLLSLLKKQFPISGAFPFRFAEQRLNSLGVLVDWSGDEASFANLARRLKVAFEKSSFDWSAVRYVGFLGPRGAVLPTLPVDLGKGVVVEVLARGNYESWSEFVRKHSHLEGIFRVHPRFQFEAISPRVLCNELALNPPLGLVFPTLEEKATRVFGQIGKEIRASQVTGPVWLAKRSFLFSLPSDPHSGVPEGSIAQYAEMRDIQLAPVSDGGEGGSSTPSSVTDLVLCSKVTLDNRGQSPLADKAFLLAEKLKQCGRTPGFCMLESDSDLFSVGSFPVFSLREVAASRGNFRSVERLLAFGVAGVQPAFLLRYLLKKPVYRIEIQEEESRILEQEPERKTALDRAKRALCVSLPYESIARVETAHELSQLFLAKPEWESEQGKGEFIPKPLSLVIPVFNALYETELCIDSLLREFPESVSLYVVDDCSAPGVSLRLEQLANENPRMNLIRHERNSGFVQACLSGLQVIPSDSDVVFVNSDVVVSSGVFEALQKAVRAKPLAALISPLSTGSHQLYLNPSSSEGLNGAAAALRELGNPNFPTVIAPDGQFLLVRRWAIERFGFFDPVYERGFCEETDLGMRMFLHGADIVCADNALVYHKQSASFGKRSREVLYQKNRALFDRRWGILFEVAHKTFLSRDPLKRVRSEYSRILPEVTFLQESFRHREWIDADSVPLAVDSQQEFFQRGDEIVFLLPNVVAGGGSLSVIQHANQMTAEGRRVIVFSLGAIEAEALQSSLVPIVQISAKEFLALNWSTQVVIATFWTTTYLLKHLVERAEQVRPYYYVQDFEPWFYEKAHPDHDAALKTYSFGFPLVAKTQFLCDTVQRECGVTVTRISPGLSDGVFYPGEQSTHVGRPRIAALFRAVTPRRRSDLLAEVLLIVARRLPEVEISLFGGNDGVPAELLPYVRLAGRLSQAEVADLYRKTDITFDLSHWQGFGRMGIESMSCGCVPILTRSGGVSTYATESNSILLDKIDPESIAQATIGVLLNRELRMELRRAGLETTQKFREKFATRDWLSLIDSRTESAAEAQARNQEVAA